MSRFIAAIVLAAGLAPSARGDEAYPPPPIQLAQVDVSVDIGAPGASVSFETFHQGLAPYGQWLTVGAYGPVWRPNVPLGWRPYYYGHWVWTDEGWLWVSDEPWGWGPYHYGRWLSDASYGWLWVPGYQWAPAWVSWRFSDDVVGWAPLGPGVSIYVTGYPAFYSSWTFVPCRSFVGVPVYSAAYAPSYQQTLFRRTMPAPPRATMYGRAAPAWGGPAHGFVEQRIGHPIRPTPIAAVASPSQIRPERGGGTVQVFRPPAPASGHPGWGSPTRPGWGPPGRVPAPGAQPGSRPAENRPGWGTPPSRGPAPVAPGPRQGAAPPAPSGERFEGGARGGYAPAPAPRGGGYAPAPAPRGGGYAPAPAPRGGGYAPAPAPRGGGYAPAPAPRGGGNAPAAPAQRGGGQARGQHERR